MYRSHSKPVYVLSVELLFNINFLIHLKFTIVKTWIYALIYNLDHFRKHFTVTIPGSLNN